MAAAEHLPLADVKNRLSEVVEQVEREHGRVVITKHGRPAAVVMSLYELEGLRGDPRDPVGSGGDGRHPPW